MHFPVGHLNGNAKVPALPRQFRRLYPLAIQGIGDRNREGKRISFPIPLVDHVFPICLEGDGLALYGGGIQARNVFDVGQGGIIGEAVLLGRVPQVYAGYHAGNVAVGVHIHIYRLIPPGGFRGVGNARQQQRGCADEEQPGQYPTNDPYDTTFLHSKRYFLSSFQG